MASYFLDSFALAKRHIKEQAHTQIDAFVADDTAGVIELFYSHAHA